MTENNSLHNAINSLYDNSLPQEELVEAERNLIGFFDLLIEIDRRQQKEARKKENYGNNRD